MTFSEIIRTMARAGRLLVIATLVGVLVGTVLAFAAPKSYQAAALVRVETSLPTEPTTTAFEEAINYANFSTITYKRLATTDVVLEPVIERLNLDVTARELAASITALAPLNTSVIEIIVTWHDDAMASVLANSIADELTKLGREDSDSGIGSVLSVVQDAVSPSPLHAPNATVIIPFFALAGLFVGLSLAFFRQWLRPRVHSTSELTSIVAVPVVVVSDGSPTGISLAANPLRKLGAEVVVAVNGASPTAIAMELGIRASAADPAHRELSEEITESQGVIVVVPQGATRRDVATATDTLTGANNKIAAWVMTDIATRGADAYARPYI